MTPEINTNIESTQIDWFKNKIDINNDLSSNFDSLSNRTEQILKMKEDQILTALEIEKNDQWDNYWAEILNKDLLNQIV